MKSYTRILMAVVLLVTLLAPLPGRADNQPAPEGRVAVQAAGRGNPWLNLRDGLTLPAAPGLASGQVQPRSLTAADFDEDGVPDLVAGYAGPGGGGLLTFYRGNVDSIYPNAPEAQARKTAGTFTDAPFFSPARVFEPYVPPDFLGAGDFDNDGHLDLVVAARGDRALNLLPGDGQGGFGQAQGLPLPGGVTALAVGEINRRDGLADVVVGVTGIDPKGLGKPLGSAVLVFEGPRGALRAEPEALAAPADVTALALGHLDDDYFLDLAAAAGSELLVVHGRDRQRAGASSTVVDQHGLCFIAVGLALGNFSPDEDYRPELALLSADGAVHLLNPTTAETITQSPIPDFPISQSPTPQLLSAKSSSLPTDDLLILDPTNHQIHLWLTNPISNTQYPIPNTPVTLDATAAPVAVLPLRLNADALDDLVILSEDGLAVSLTAPMSTFTVDSALDAGDISPGDGICRDLFGDCTLRAAIMQANASAGADQIDFDLGAGTPTIAVGSGGQGLPDITEALTILGNTGGASRVELNGQNVTSDFQPHGLDIIASNTTVRGLVINRFKGDGIHLGDFYGIANCIVEGNLVGTDAAGAKAQGNGWNGVGIERGADNTIGGMTTAACNIVSGNGTGLLSGGSGIEIIWSARNQVQGNYIGVDVSGASAVGNVNAGVEIRGSSDNTVGGTTPGAGNLISGNGTADYLGSGGVSISTLPSYPAANNLVQGNRIGTDAAGNPSLGNVGEGVYVYDDTNTIGGSATGAGNVIAGNARNGVCLTGASALNTEIWANSIFVNGWLGIDLDDTGGDLECDGAATPNDSGDLDGGPNHLQNWPGISGMAVQGDELAVTFRVDSPATWVPYPLQIDFYLADNAPVNAEGQTYLGSVQYLESEAQTVVTRSFVPAQMPGAHTRIVAMATDAQGNTSEFSRSASRAGDLVVNSTGDGSDIYPSDDLCDTGNWTPGGDPECTLRAAIETANATPEADWIVFDIPGSGVPTIQPQSALPRVTAPAIIDGTTQPDSSKVELKGSSAGSASGLKLGGDNSTVRGLVINNFGGHGIVLESGSNTIIGNIIGLDASGMAAAGNKGHGIFVNAVAGNTIGGTTEGARNVISGNDGDGIKISNGGADDNRVLGNYIGVSAAGDNTGDNPENPLGNAGNGVYVFDQARRTIIGGMAAGERNVISGNGDSGVFLSAFGTDHVVVGNYVGVDSTGAKRIGNCGGPNGCGGIILGADDTTVSGNLIAGNWEHGLWILGSGNWVHDNIIGTNAVGNALLANDGDGIHMEDASDNIIEDNLISANGDYGLRIEGEKSKFNKIAGNRIGTTTDGVSRLGNHKGGIYLHGASYNIIGGVVGEGMPVGPCAYPCNLISGNGLTGLGPTDAPGIRIWGAKGNRILGNFVGTELNGQSALGNTEAGIYVEYASFTTIKGNVIAGNDRDGVKLEIAEGNSVRNNLISGNLHGVTMSSAQGTDILENWIGTGLDGTSQWPNRSAGVDMPAEMAANIRIVGNRVWYNPTGIDTKCWDGCVIKDNSIIENTGSTGIHCDGCAAEITDNLIASDGSDGMVCENGAEPTVHDNNLVDNAGYGLRNLDSSVTISAEGNWWGAADGPGGVGPGSGDEVSDQVDYDPWRTSPVAVVVVPYDDPVYVARGATGTNEVFFQNWENLTDILTVTLTDSQGWLLPPITFDVTLDGLGAAVPVSFTVPAGTAIGTVDEVTVTATSQANPSASDSATFQVIAALVADLEVVKEGPDLAGLLPFSYTITVTNGGPDVATNVAVTDTLPITLTFVSAQASQGTCTALDGTVACQLGPLGVGVQATVAVTAALTSTTDEWILNVVEVAGDQHDAVPTNNLDVEYTPVGTVIYLPLVVRGSLSSSQAPAPAGDEAPTGQIVPTAVDLQGVISPTSSFLLYSRADDTTIWLKDEASHAKLMDGIRPGLSPDGRYLAYQDEAIFGDLYVHDLATGQSALIYDASAHLLVASWTPDGSRLVFDHGCRIYGIDRDGGNLETLIDTWPGSDYCYNDSPDVNRMDGRLAWENEKYGLGLAEADGSNPTWIPNTQPDDYSPRWSPDGQWLAFWRDNDVFKIRPDGTDLTQLSFVPAGSWMEDSGQWTSDGEYLVAAAQVGGVEGLYAVPTDGSGQLSLLVLRDWESPDWVGSAGSLGVRRVFLPLVLR